MKTIVVSAVLLLSLLAGDAMQAEPVKAGGEGLCSCSASSIFGNCQQSGACPCTCFCRFWGHCRCECGGLKITEPQGD